MLAYDKAWSALNMLIREGNGFSGHERNCAYLNLGTNSDRYANISAVTGLDFDDDGRGLAHCDWDGDGDLDLWVTNRTGPRVRFLRNDSPAAGRSVAFRLRGKECNRDAIGARLVLNLKEVGKLPNATLHKSLRAGHSHMSQSSKWVHFGLGDAEPDFVAVHWPGGEVEEFGGVATGGRYLLEQGSGSAVPAPKPGAQEFAPSVPEPVRASDAGRIVLLKPAPVPELEWQALAGETERLDSLGKPVLLNLWATTCGPCVGEMSEWAAASAEFAKYDLEIVAVSVDDPDLANQKIQSFVERIKFPYKVGRPAGDLIEKLETLQRSFIGRQLALPTPSSFLIDANQELVAIYRGPVSGEQLLADLKLLGAKPADVLAAAVPFEGRWLGEPKTTEARTIALKFLSRGHPAHALAYAHRLVEIGRANPSRFSAAEVVGFENLIGGIHYDLKDYKNAAKFWMRVVEQSPGDRNTRLNLARSYNALGEMDGAIRHLRIALDQRRRDPENLAHLARFVRGQGALQEAVDLFRESIGIAPSKRVQIELSETLAGMGDIAGAADALRGLLKRWPDWPPAANNLAWILAASPDDRMRDGEEALRLAQVAAEACRFQRPYVLGTLAAAHAENGAFDKAVEFATKAVDMAKERGETTAAERIAPAIEIYREKRPYRDESLAPTRSGGRGPGWRWPRPYGRCASRHRCESGD